MTPQSNHADFGMVLSITSAAISIASIQPIVTFVASLVAIVSGVFAIRYYYKAAKKFK
jgi:fermentation-respiration switch protein FrsA (DUF1100 family)